jgi:hypothetical protein
VFALRQMHGRTVRVRLAPLPGAPLDWGFAARSPGLALAGRIRPASAPRPSPCATVQRRTAWR